jgi:hypothetical protein
MKERVLENLQVVEVTIGRNRTLTACNSRTEGSLTTLDTSTSGVSKGAICSLGRYLGMKSRLPQSWHTLQKSVCHEVIASKDSEN